MAAYEVVARRNINNLEQILDHRLDQFGTRQYLIKCQGQEDSEWVVYRDCYRFPEIIQQYWEQRPAQARQQLIPENGQVKIERVESLTLTFKDSDGDSLLKLQLEEDFHRDVSDWWEQKFEKFGEAFLDESFDEDKCLTVAPLRNAGGEEVEG